MKLFNLIVLAIASISTVLAAADYEITYYGCPNECSTQRHGSCHVPTYPIDDDGTKYFCAISTKLSGYKSYCGKFVVLMLTNGSKKMLSVKIADTCSNCDKYHIDLSSYSFGEILEMKKGEAEVVFGIYDKSGNNLLGPIYKSHPASKFNLSKEAFFAAFDANAKNMVKNGKHTADFNSSETGSITTTSATTTPGALATPTLLNNGTIINPSNSTNTTITTTKNVPKKPQEKKPVQTQIGKAVNEVSSNESPTVGIITALGGTALGAAGIGLLVMKKKSPGTYEDMKQKFPEAFSQVKRGISRRATSIKRRVTRRVPAPAPALVPTNDVSSV